jgi:hypothetical protein
MTRTMHCYKEVTPLEPEENEYTWYYMSINETYRRKGNCARDLVAECRRCARPVCRVSGLRPSTYCPVGIDLRRTCQPCFPGRGNLK